MWNEAAEDRSPLWLWDVDREALNSEYAWYSRVCSALLALSIGYRFVEESFTTASKRNVIKFRSNVITAKVSTAFLAEFLTFETGSWSHKNIDALPGL